MGTNYYINEDYCEKCGRGNNRRHIGKSSGGWCFSLHIYPEDDIHNLDDWKRIFNSSVNRIEDEYGRPVSALEMIDAIENRKGQEPRKVTPYGYSSWAEFHSKNGSQDGPNNLIRHCLDGYCIGHGKGTYDYIIGDFS